MIRSLVQRLSYANVMATLAVFVALGGSSYAVSKINGKQLKNRSVPGVKLKRNTLTGSEINESRLGRVPDAARLGGLDPGSFLRSTARAVDSARLGGLDPGSFLRSTGTAADSARLGGLSPGAFERSAQRFEIEDPSSLIGNEQSITLGPFTLTPKCGLANDAVTIASTEPNSAAGSVTTNNGQEANVPNLGSTEANVVISPDSAARIQPVVIWAVAPSGYRLLLQGWLGRDVLGKSCVVFGGVAVTS